jgi:hypothetical protein
MLNFNLNECFPACPYQKHQNSGQRFEQQGCFHVYLRFHASAGYLQHFTTLLKELNTHHATDPVPPDQYEVELVALSDSNLNVPCKSV